MENVDRGLGFSGLTGLATRQVGRLQTAGVVLVLSLALLMGGFLMRGAGHLEVELHLFRKVREDFFDQLGFVHNALIRQREHHVVPLALAQEQMLAEQKFASQDGPLGIFLTLVVQVDSPTLMHLVFPASMPQN